MIFREHSVEKICRREIEINLGQRFWGDETKDKEEELFGS